MVVVVTGGNDCKNDEAMKRKEEKGGVDLLFFPVSLALRQKIRRRP